MSLPGPRPPDSTVTWKIYEIGQSEICAALGINDGDASVEIELSGKQRGITVTVKRNEIRPS